MTVLKAHFDGKVLIPDEPVNLPVDCALEVRVQPMPATEPIGISADARPLMQLVKALEQFPDNPDWPSDGAAQHDHYLYGLPKRP